MFIRCKKTVIIAVAIILSLSPVFARSKESAINENPENNYYKYIHPREYVFDLSDAKEKIVLKFNDSTGKLACNVDFTELVKMDMPRKGDTITIKFEGTASKNLMNVTAAIYDIKRSVNIGQKLPILLIKPTKKGESFSNSISVQLSDNADESLVMVLISAVAEGNKKTDRVEFKLKRVTKSTNTKTEAEELKKAIKEKKNIIEVTYSNPEASTITTSVTDTKTAAESPAEVTASLENETSETKVPPKIIDSSETEEIPEATASQITESVQETATEQITEQRTESTLAQTAEPVSEQPAESFIEQVSDQTQTQIAEADFEQTSEPIPEQVQVQAQEPPSTKTSSTPVTRYKKEYLQDYAVPEELTVELPATDSLDVIENPNEADSHGRTLLMQAAKLGNDWQIKNLLKAGADVNLKDREGWTALMYAVRYQENENCVELLLQAGADVKAVNMFETSALKLAACYNNNPQIIKKILSYYTISEKEVLASFVLLISENHTAEYVQISKLKVFLEQSIPVNTFYNGKTPLMYAAQYGNSTKVIKLLLDYDSIPSIRSTENKTAFDYAKENTALKHDSIFWSLNKK